MSSFSIGSGNGNLDKRQFKKKLVGIQSVEESQGIPKHGFRSATSKQRKGSVKGEGLF